MITKNKLPLTLIILFVNHGPSTEKSIPKFWISWDIINSLENKSTGPSRIPLKMLSVIPDLIILPLTYIIKLSFSTDECPDLLKIVKVMPTHKGGSMQDMNNYRPISLLSIFDKIIEKLIHKRLYSFIEEHNIL